MLIPLLNTFNVAMNSRTFSSCNLHGQLRSRLLGTETQNNLAYIGLPGIIYVVLIYVA